MNQTLHTTAPKLTARQQQYMGRQMKFELFSMAWAIAALFHMANHRSYTLSLAYFLLTISAILVLVKPSSIGRLTIFILLQIFQVLTTLASVSNHWLFTAFVNLTIIQAILYLAIKNKSFAINKEDLLKTFAPVVRIELIILYFYVVFHKLNADFFAPAVSCATEFLVAQDSTGFAAKNIDLLSFNAYLTIIIEAIIPVFLCFKKTRNAGLLIGLLFHCIVAYNPKNGFYDFSSMIFGTYILFTSQEFTDQVYRGYTGLVSWKNKFKKSVSAFTLQRLVVILAGVAVVFSLLMLLILTLNTKNFFREVFWSAYNFSFIGIFLIAMSKTNSNKVTIAINPFKLPTWSFLLFPLIVFINGLSPYLGLKTENSFAMFSNLRTEGGKTNHYIVPASTQVFDYQKDLVQLVSSSDDYLQELAGRNQLMVYFSFKSYVRVKKPERIEYLRNGKQHVFDLKDPSTHEGLLTPAPVLLRKLLRFRTFSKYDPQPCNH